MACAASIEAGRNPSVVDRYINVHCSVLHCQHLRTVIVTRYLKALTTQRNVSYSANDCAYRFGANSVYHSRFCLGRTSSWLSVALFISASQLYYCHCYRV